jgi:putative endonuclease
MSSLRGALGRFAENLAAAYVQRHGYRIVARNLRLGLDEIDILAVEGGQTVLIEVRARRGDALGPPQWSLSAAKIARLRRAALALLEQRPDLPGEQRIDLVAISLTRAGQVRAIELLRNALGA